MMSRGRKRFGSSTAIQLLHPIADTHSFLCQVGDKSGWLAFSTPASSHAELALGAPGNTEPQLGSRGQNGAKAAIRVGVSPLLHLAMGLQTRRKPIASLWKSGANRCCPPLNSRMRFNPNRHRDTQSQTPTHFSGKSEVKMGDSHFPISQLLSPFPTPS